MVKKLSRTILVESSNGLWLWNVNGLLSINTHRIISAAVWAALRDSTVIQFPVCRVHISTFKVARWSANYCPLRRSRDAVAWTIVHVVVNSFAGGVRWFIKDIGNCSTTSTRWPATEVICAAWWEGFRQQARQISVRLARWSVLGLKQWINRTILHQLVSVLAEKREEVALVDLLSLNVELAANLQ